LKEQYKEGSKVEDHHIEHWIGSREMILGVHIRTWKRWHTVEEHGESGAL